MQRFMGPGRNEWGVTVKLLQGVGLGLERLNGKADWFFSLQPQPCHGVINAGLFVYFRFFFKFILMCISLLSAYMSVTTCMLVPAESRREC